MEVLENLLENLLEKLEEKIYSQYYRKINEVACRSGDIINFTSLIYLDVIASLGNPTYSQVADYLQVSRPAVTQMVTPLIESGYLVKVRDTADKRVYRLRATDKFLKYYRIDEEYTNGLLKKINKVLTNKEKEQLIYVLQKIDQEI